MKDIIVTENLCKDFGETKVVNNLNLEIKEGDIFGLIGPNGAGKTTTILMLNGFYQPTKGKIFINNTDVTKDKKNHKKSLGYLPDRTGFYELMTARDNLKFFASFYDLTKKKIQLRIEELLEYVSLSYAADQRVKTFSLGMRQRLGLAKALIHQPEILIMDEPQSGLDFEGIELLRKLIKKLASEGKTVLFSSHQLTEIMQLCTSIGILFKGRLLYQGELINFINQLKEEYQGSEINPTDEELFLDYFTRH